MPNCLGRSALLAALPLALIELSGPVLGERKNGGTPWHPHHIAERYGLLVIVALGEGMIGTMAAMSAVVAPGGPGYSVDFVLVLFAGVALTFGIWWVYFVLPFGDLLHAHRERPFGWGYGHIPVFGAIVAVGAGLHAAAFYLEDHTELNATGTALTVAIPVAIVTSEPLSPLLGRGPNLRSVPCPPDCHHHARSLRVQWPWRPPRSPGASCSSRRHRG